MNGPSDSLVDTTIGDHWRILHLLDAGAVGVIYVAEHVETGKQGALKLLHDAYSTSNEHVRRFAREARAMSRLQHVNCVSVLDMGAHQGRPYLVMELIAGTPLSQEVGTPEM